MERNYNHIKSWQDVRQSNYIRFEVRKSLDESFNSVHLGCQILSYSNRIMNQVLATAEDIGVKAFYTDTDSMMLQKSGVAKLREEYKNKYGRELIGKNLGEFSSDFEMAGCKNVKSVGFIGLGKMLRS